MISASQFPPLLSWAPAATALGLSQTMSASLATLCGAFDSAAFASAAAAFGLPGAVSFDPAGLQAVASASFAAGLAASGACARIERAATALDGAPPAELNLAPAELLALADAIAVNNMLPAQGSGAFAASLAAGDLPITQSILHPTPSFMALAQPASRAYDEIDDDAAFQDLESCDDASEYGAADADDDAISISSSLIDLAGFALPPAVPTKGRRHGAALTREDARAAAAKRKRRAKVAVPDEKKDDRYWQRREKNNEAARRNRMMKKAVEGVTKDRLPALNTENTRLTDEVALLRSELKGLVALLRKQLVAEGMATDHPLFA